LVGLHFSVCILDIYQFWNCRVNKDVMATADSRQMESESLNETISANRILLGLLMALSSSFSFLILCLPFRDDLETADPLADQPDALI